MIKVIVAERNQIVRGGIQSALRDAPECRIAAEATSAEQLLWCFTAISHDVLLIESGFLDMVGLQTLEDYAVGAPAPRVIVHSHAYNPSAGLVALQNGASAYLSNRCSLAELREAIFQVALGRRYIDSAFAKEIASFLMVSPSALPSLLLSSIELRIYKMLTLGLPFSGIAAQLNLSVKAVAIGEARITEKLRLDGIAELVQSALATGVNGRADEVETVCAADQ